jgi:nicotinate phosphoribosyltransferase
MTVTALSTDLYQLTMMAGYFESGRHELPATFELFVRRLPEHRAFLLTAGLAQALDELAALHFTAEEVEWLRASSHLTDIPDAFFQYLTALRFSGEVWAMPEGTPCFPNEPILRVTAPLAQAQLVETMLLAIVNYQTSVASKAARIVHAAAGRPVMEFGARRAHGIDAALAAARAAFIGGCDGTSLVEAGRRYGIPISGTMAHSWVLAAETEREAFVSYTDLFQRGSVLLLDTFDTIAAARLVIESGLLPTAVRIDSGDLVSLSRTVRQVFDEAGLRVTRILASGDLDEWRVARLLAAGAAIDGFGVGTALSTSEDAPALGGVYKLVQIEQGGRVRPVMKFSPAKATWPGRKQVWRIFDGRSAIRDIVALDAEPGPDRAEPLLAQVMLDGKRVGSPPTLSQTRTRAREMLAQLPDELRHLDTRMRFAVEPSDALQALMRQGRPTGVG